jgi:hypothetical protein
MLLVGIKHADLTVPLKKGQRKKGAQHKKDHHHVLSPIGLASFNPTLT